MRRQLIYFTFLILVSNFGFIVSLNGQTSNDFREKYRAERNQLINNFSNVEKNILLQRNAGIVLDDTSQLIQDLIYFEINNLNENTFALKDLGKQLKTKEILFNDYHIKSVISLKYLKTLYALNQKEVFEQEAKKLIFNAKKNRDYFILSSTYLLNAYHKLSLQQRDSTVYYANLALINARKQTDKLLLINIVLDQADLYRKLKNDDVAIAKAYLALQLSVESNYHFGIYIGNIMLATINAQHNNISEMHRNLVQARDAALKINYDYGVLNTQIIELQYTSNYTEAHRKTLEKIRQTEVNNPQILASISLIEAQMFIRLKDYPQALNRLNSAIVEYEKSGDLGGLQLSYQKVADVFLNQQKYDKAISYLQKSYSLSSEVNNASESALLLKKIAEIYELKGDTRSAFTNLKRYVDVKDSLQLADLQMNLLIQQQQSKADERERLITLQSDSIQEQRRQQEYTTTVLENVQLKNNLKTYVIIGFAGLMLLAGIIVFFKWNQNLIQQQQNEAEMNQTLLRTQMNPHFVFNAMSVIQSYIYDNDTKNSTKFLVNFSKLMRLILENSSKEFIPIQIEQEILEKYLSVQKLRFEDRFSFSIFTEPNLLDEEIMIPPMITQPFIENAIEHGQLHLKEDGFISVSFKKLDDRLVEIKVTDNGIGWNNKQPNEKKEHHKSMAIGITKSRITSLNKKHKTEGSLQYENYDLENNTGTVVTVTIPFKV